MGWLHSILEAFKPLENQKIRTQTSEEKKEEPKVYMKTPAQERLEKIQEKWRNKKVTDFGSCLELCSDIQSLSGKGGDIK